MKVEKDYEEFLRLLNRNKVRYCIVGAYAVAFHARPKYTKDIDILIEPEEGNAARLLAALREFGFGSLNISSGDFTKRGRIIQLGHEPVRIDLLTSLPGCGFARIWKNRKRGIYGAERVYFIGLQDLIRSKRAAGRKQDEADIELLRASRPGRGRKRASGTMGVK
ncbi:MAG: hypothetical protein PHN82_01030 [bacterium]|nr:hypothetical protein [bacterium]